VVADFALLMTTARRQQHLGLLFLFIAVISWSSAGLFSRLLNIDTQGLLFWRGVFGVIGMLPIIAFVPATGGIAGFSKLGWPGLAYAVITALSMVFFISALRHTSVAHVAVITAAVPFAAAYLGWAVLKETPSASSILASAVALFGVAVMVGISSDGHWTGDALAGIMAMTMAVMILISRKHQSIPALQATCVASALSALMVLPFMHFEALSNLELATLVGFAIATQVLGFGLFALGSSRLPPTQTALITALEAPLAPLWVWLLLSEVPALATIMGGALVVAAVVGHVLWEGRPRASVSSPTSSA
jgi:drug/metabolite transporter (DMT)-like permease